MRVRGSRPFAEYHEEQMQDPEFAAVYRALEPEFQVAREVIRLRLEQGLSQEELARKAGTGQPNISRRPPACPPAPQKLGGRGGNGGRGERGRQLAAHPPFGDGAGIADLRGGKDIKDRGRLLEAGAKPVGIEE